MFYSSLLFFAALLPIISADDSFKSRTVNPDLNAQLRAASTNQDRLALLSKDSDWYYDFDSHPNYNNKKGAVVVADAAAVPALVGQGSALSLLKLAPCGMLPPHLHPRATNLVVGITGNTTSWFINENGSRTVSVNIKPMRMTIFPQGSLHTMQNNGCKPALLLSALNSEDPGTLNILPSLWTVPRDIIQAGFHDPTLDTDTIGRGIPAVGTGAIIGSEECKARCGITD